MWKLNDKVKTCLAELGGHATVDGEPEGVGDDDEHISARTRKGSFKKFSCESDWETYSKTLNIKRKKVVTLEKIGTFWPNMVICGPISPC